MTKVFVKNIETAVITLGEAPEMTLSFSRHGNGFDKLS